MKQAVFLAGLAIGAASLAACSATVSEPAGDEVQVAEPAPMAAPQALQDWASQQFGEDGYAEVKHAAFDLNGDGTDELLAYFTGPMICGSGGCNLYVFEQGADGLIVRGNLRVTRLPVGVGEGNEQGWRDLVVTIGGGGAAGGLRNVPWTGEAYHSNPTVPPALPVDSMETELLSWD